MLPIGHESGLRAFLRLGTGSALVPFFLPGLVTLDAPLPLGGTSNHFRRSALRALGGWDPYNVTEDCDLGIRMFREHYQIKVLESTTLEEANSDFVNWVKQRSRWYKGYLQTFLIHWPLVRLRGWHPDPGRGQPDLLGYDPCVVHRSAAVPRGDLSGSRVLRRPVSVGFRELLAVVPDGAHGAPHSTGGPGAGRHARAIYWAMMSIAAVKAMWQLVMTPSFWEKTAHGLDSDADSEEEQPERLRLVS